MTRAVGRWRGLQTDEVRVKVLSDMLAQRLDGYERILSKQKYLAGDVSDHSTPLSLLFQFSVLMNNLRRRPSLSSICGTCRTVGSSRTTSAQTSSRRVQTFHAGGMRLLRFLRGRRSQRARSKLVARTIVTSLAYQYMLLYA